MKVEMASSAEKSVTSSGSSGTLNPDMIAQLHKMLVEEVCLLFLTFLLTFLKREAREKLQQQVVELVSKVNELEKKVKGIESKNDSAAMNDVMSMLKF